MGESLERLEDGVGRALRRIAELRAEGDTLRAENSRMAGEISGLREKLASLERGGPGSEEARRLRSLERQRRELRGRVAELLRIAESLNEEA